MGGKRKGSLEEQRKNIKRRAALQLSMTRDSVHRETQGDFIKYQAQTHSISSVPQSENTVVSKDWCLPGEFEASHWCGAGSVLGTASGGCMMSVSRCAVPFREMMVYVLTSTNSNTNGMSNHPDGPI